MTPRYGIDTSVLVRLLTGDPPAEFERCQDTLLRLVQAEDAAVTASNQVIGEAYIAVQHHYGVSRADARAGLLGVLRSGLVEPLNGNPVLAALEAPPAPGSMDRLIANDYGNRGCHVLTLDRRMASLPDITLL